MSSAGQLTPTPRLLLGPGPSDAHPRVLTAMTTPLLGHLDPEYLVLMDETRQLLRETFLTTNPLTIAVPATGMAGMETCLVNLLEPGDKALICVSGFFGGRLVEIASRAGAEVIVLEQQWGQVFDLNVIREKLQEIKPQLLAIVHAETSTGALQPLDELGKLCHEFDTLLLADTVTSLGCVPLKLDDWKIDAVYSCSQKGLGCPPGLSPVSFSPRAQERIANRKTKVQSWYFDLTMLETYWNENRAYHHTAPISMTYALREGLRIIQEEGLENRWHRHQRNHQALKAGLEAIGLNYTAAEGHQLPQLNAVHIPEGVDDLTVRKKLLNDFSIEIGGGLGDLKGKAWRIGLMGYNSRPEVVFQLLGALEQCLLAAGHQLEAGKSLAAANGVYLRQN